MDQSDTFGSQPPLESDSLGVATAAAHLTIQSGRIDCQGTCSPLCPLPCPSPYPQSPACHHHPPCRCPLSHSHPPWLVQVRIQYEWRGRTGLMEASVDDDVRSLRSRLHKKTGLPAWQGVRLKCRLDLRDSYPVSAIDQTVQVMESGGVPGGAGAKRARNPLDSSDDEDSLETRGSPSSASPAASEAADDEGEEGARLVETASSDESEGEGEAEGEGP